MSRAARDHRKLILMLQYIGRDYRDAVEDGSIINPFEYREISTFCDEVIEIYTGFQQGLEKSETVFELQQLRQMVYEKSDLYSISDLSKTLVNELSAELATDSSPLTTPDLASGKRSYQAGGCPVCHGLMGDGDGWAAGWLEPAPGSFREEGRMRDATPYYFFNVIELGVTGTSMPSFEEAFSSQEVWDIAFYLMTLRDGFNPQPPGGSLDLTLTDLATKSDLDLMEEMADRGQQGDLSAAIDFLRGRPEVLE